MTHLITRGPRRRHHAFTPSRNHAEPEAHKGPKASSQLQALTQSRQVRGAQGPQRRHHAFTHSQGHAELAAYKGPKTSSQLHALTRSRRARGAQGARRRHHAFTPSRDHAKLPPHDTSLRAASRHHAVMTSQCKRIAPKHLGRHRLRAARFQLNPIRLHPGSWLSQSGANWHSRAQSQQHQYIRKPRESPCIKLQSGANLQRHGFRSRALMTCTLARLTQRRARIVLSETSYGPHGQDPCHLAREHQHEQLQNHSCSVAYQQASARLQATPRRQKQHTLLTLQPVQRCLI